MTKDTIHVKVPCECGETAAMDLEPQDAVLYALRMLVLALDVNSLDLLPVLRDSDVE